MIDGWLIKQDADGRYCLNDLHKASGDVGHQRPSKWLTTESTNQLIEELEARNRASKALVTRRGRGITGTYAVKELVYAYAMWRSRKRHAEYP